MTCPLSVKQQQLQAYCWYITGMHPASREKLILWLPHLFQNPRQGLQVAIPV